MGSRGYRRLSKELCGESLQGGVGPGLALCRPSTEWELCSSLGVVHTSGYTILGGLGKVWGKVGTSAGGHLFSHVRDRCLLPRQGVVSYTVPGTREELSPSIKPAKAPG